MFVKLSIDSFTNILLFMEEEGLPADRRRFYNFYLKNEQISQGLLMRWSV